ncbi:MAG: C25 family cysteine peptidase [Candidatus Sumerlaeaceae bacterium]|nr:C25 family cysteine peptidase [Candidatus Sumerlaeaceae bacterium]
MKTLTLHHPTKRTALALTPILLFFALMAAAKPADSDATATLEQLREVRWLREPHVRLAVRYCGGYRVTGEDLAAAGVDLAAIKPDRLGLWNGGRPVPVEVRVSNPARLQPADSLHFIGDAPRGTFSTYMPFNLRNVYYLTWSDENPVQYRRQTHTTTEPATADAAFMEDMLLERDNLLQYARTGPGVTDYYFWVGQVAGAEYMYPVSLSFPGFDPRPGLPARLTLRVFGQTEVAAVRPGHLFDVKWGDLHLGRISFDGIRYHDFETTVPATQTAGTGRLTLLSPPERKDVVDRISLDNIRLRYPRRLDAEGRNIFVFNTSLVGDAKTSAVIVSGLQPGSVIYDMSAPVAYTANRANETTITVRLSDTPSTCVAVSPAGWMRPDAISLRTPTDELYEIPPDVEAIVVCHPRTARGARALADYRNSTGLRTHVVDVTRIYDALDHGYISSTALKRYLRFVRQQSDKLRYIVLIGDSTNNYREMVHAEPEDPDEALAAHTEILIPIHWVYQPQTTYSFGYPNDNWYGSFAWPNAPDIAVGRIPANSDEDVFHYLRKVIEYEQLQKSRDDRLLLISSVEASFQQLVMQTRDMLAERFTTSTTLFPESAVAEREVARIREEIDGGVQLIYYVGHGGAFVWRVGPIDFKQQKDLFTPADVGKLRNAGHYPVIVCSSCYVTSFDNQYSLGEAFLLQPQAGGIAVIGTPWKTGVYENHAFNEHLLRAYGDMANKRLGDIFMVAKRATRPPNPDVVDFQTFTILGDPCLELVRKP